MVGRGCSFSSTTHPVAVDVCVSLRVFCCLALVAAFTGGQPFAGAPRCLGCCKTGTGRDKGSMIVPARWCWPPPLPPRTHTGPPPPPPPPPNPPPPPPTSICRITPPPISPPHPPFFFSRVRFKALQVGVKFLHRQQCSLQDHSPFFSLGLG